METRANAALLTGERINFVTAFYRNDGFFLLLKMMQKTPTTATAATK